MWSQSPTTTSVTRAPLRPAYRREDRADGSYFPDLRGYIGLKVQWTRRPLEQSARRWRANGLYRSTILPVRGRWHLRSRRSQTITPRHALRSFPRTSAQESPDYSVRATRRRLPVANATRSAPK